MNNLIKVHSIDDESTGYFFLSYDGKKSFVITTKHGVCDQKSRCPVYKNRVNNCCQICSYKSDVSQLNLLNQEQKLKIKNIYYETNKDIVLIEVSENAINKLKINNKINTEKYFSYGFIKEETKKTRLILDFPQLIDGKIHYNLYSDSTPELEAKSESYYGFSGALVFTFQDKDPVVKGIIIENGNHNDLIAEDLSDLNFDSINNFFECSVFDRTLFEIDLKTNLNQHFSIIHTNKLSNELELVLYAPKKLGYPHYDLGEICNAIAHEFYQIFLPKGGNVNFLPFKAVNIILDNNKLDPINKLLSARVAEAYLNAPHLYSTSLNDSLYHHAHYLFINEGLDIAVSFYCGHNSLEKNIQGNIENIILNANSYHVNQKLLLERSFLDQNLDQEVCDRLFDIIFNFQGRINNFCLIFTISMEDYYTSEFTDVNSYIIHIIKESCKKIDNITLKKLEHGLNLHIIVIPINRKNEITETFLKGIHSES